jgi:ribosome recycling factor
MHVDDILLDAEGRMEKAAGILKKALGGVRTGHANPGLVDSLRIDVYGSPTPIKAIASVSAPEPNQLVVRPFDPSTLKDIEKGILASDLGLNPQSDGKLIRINIPPLSTEVRQRLVARIKELCEEAKIAIRNIRRDANKVADQGQKEKLLSEDDRDHVKKEVLELTRKYETLANELAQGRKKEVLED